MKVLVSRAMLHAQSDRRLATLAREGHECAFEAIIERYTASLFRLCRSVVGGDRAEEAVQETLLRAWSSLQNGADVRDLRAWLHRIARNTSYDLARRNLDEYELAARALRGAAGPPQSCEPDVECEKRIATLHAAACVSSLPERQRQALLQTAVYGKSHRAVANNLGVTDGAVRQLVRRARVALRAAPSLLLPLPVLVETLKQKVTHSGIVQRTVEMTTGSGANPTAILVKGGAAVLATGAIFTGSVVLAPSSAQRRSPAQPPAVQASKPPAASALPNNDRGTEVAWTHLGRARVKHAGIATAHKQSPYRHSGQSGFTSGTSSSGGMASGTNGQSTLSGSGTSDGGLTSSQSGSSGGSGSVSSGNPDG
jgi:RNA polymerase sigma factor (sigma-70 family)